MNVPDAVLHEARETVRYWPREEIEFLWSLSEAELELLVWAIVLLDVRPA